VLVHLEGGVRGTEGSNVPSRDVLVSSSSTPQEAGMFEVVATEGDVLLGFKPNAMPPERVVVDEVQPGSWSDLNGITPGDELIACNGESVTHIDSPTLKTRMRMRPLHLSFSRGLSSVIVPRSERTPSSGKLTSSSETAVTSTMPDVESSVSYVEDSYMYTPSALASDTRSSRVSLTFQSDSVSPAWVASQGQCPALATHAIADASSNTSTPVSKELSDSLRAALFDQEASPDMPFPDLASHLGFGKSTEDSGEPVIVDTPHAPMSTLSSMGEDLTVLHRESPMEDIRTESMRSDQIMLVGHSLSAGQGEEASVEDSPTSKLTEITDTFLAQGDVDCPRTPASLLDTRDDNLGNSPSLQSSSHDESEDLSF